MRIIYNRIIPPSGYKCVNILGVLFAREGAEIDDVTLSHEAIHTAQMREMAYILFYVWYVAEFLAKLCRYRSWHEAYRAVGFEREAYANEADAGYLDGREAFAWTGYVRVGDTSDDGAGAEIADDAVTVDDDGDIDGDTDGDNENKTAAI